MTEDNAAAEPRGASPEGDGPPQAVSRVLTWLVRLLLVILIGAFLGAGLYFGVPALLQAAVEPVQENRARIEQLEEELERRDREQRRERVEISDDVAELQGLVTQLVERVAEVEARADSVDQELDVLEEQGDELAALADDLDALERDIEALQGELRHLEAAQREPQEQLDQLRQQVQRLRALHLIRAAREALAAEEFEEAGGWIERARDEVVAAEGLGQVVERLELALEALESEHFTAADRDLQTALETLLTELSVAPTVTPGVTPTDETEGADS